MNKYFQGIYLNIFLPKQLPFSFYFIRNFFSLYHNKTIYFPSECTINKCTLSKKYLFLKPASGSENYHEFLAYIGIGISIKYRDSYRNRYKIWCRPITGRKGDFWVPTSGRVPCLVMGPPVCNLRLLLVRKRLPLSPSLI